MNAHFLKGYMSQKGDDMESLARALNINVSTLYMKMAGKKEGQRSQQFTQDEIKFITDRYSLTPDDVMKIFFN